MTLTDPTKGLIGQVIGTPTERLGYRTVEHDHRTRRVELDRATKWTNLDYRNSWGNYSSSDSAGLWQLGQYRRTADGSVELRGLVTRTPFGSALWTAGQVVAVFPAGFAPTNPSSWNREMLVPMCAATTGATGLGRLDILANADGTANLILQIGAPANNVAWMNLNGLRFSTY